MLPCAYQVIRCNLAVRYGSIAFRQSNRPQVIGLGGRCGAPYYTAHMTHHYGVAETVSAHICRQTTLRAVEPFIGSLLLEDTTMRNTNPSVSLFKTVGMSHYGIAVSTTVGKITSCDIIIRALDILTAYHTGIIRNIQTVICHEQVIVTVLVYNLRCLTALPAGAQGTGSYSLSVTCGQFFGTVGPGITQGMLGLAALRINLQEGESAVP